MANLIERLEALAPGFSGPCPEWGDCADDEGPCLSCAAWDELRTEQRELLSALPALLKAIRAVVVTAWNEKDGRCWCTTSPETRDGKHEPRCALARAALQPLFGGGDS